MNAENYVDNYRQQELEEKPWQRAEEQEVGEEPDFEAIRKYVNHVAYLYDKTRYLLASLKNTIHSDLSNAVDDLGRNMDVAVNRKISFIRPFLKSLMRANSRSLLGNMMKRIKHSQG
ncbi:hypothetical protein GE061_007762 [Apolygus lucorum]|uniref:Uncharacterized protein n=1 Tax=Apolygus lucorum TaxID=248454 RepID=A0A8S9WMP5_APOLU|nr:hypothetical protein GE061_007762 [Apolygus lucorum]